MAAICIVSGAHLCRNPRVVKEAETLSSGGHEVSVFSPLLLEELAEEDGEILKGAEWGRKVTVDLRPRSVNRSSRMLSRGRRRLGTEAVRLIGYETPQALGYGVSRTLRLARGGKFDLYIAHQEVGAWVGYELSREGKRVGADIEDWYSRDLLPEARDKRPLRLIEKCEAHLLRTGRHVTTMSDAMASTLSETYGSPKPKVIYNCFPWAERGRMDNVKKDRVNQALPSLHWLSQTIGPGRGLETLCAALNTVTTPVEVHLRGASDAGTEDWLRGLITTGRGHEVYFHKLVPNHELLSRIAEHDVGLALEPAEPDNKNLTVSNKILHYLLAGLAVVASDTAGQAEISRTAPTAVKLFKNGTPDELAGALNRLLAHPAELAAARAAALEAAKDVYCWERQAPLLLESVAAALAP
jgi:glycosyltransferase involved in cell wall biosynthesis